MTTTPTTTIPDPKTKEWHERRRLGIGGSDANILMSGDPEAILKLWKIKTGKVAPDDLSGEFRVALGSYTEAFNADWFSMKTGFPIIARNDFRKAHRPLPTWMQSNLDGEVLLPNGKSAVFEAKHTSGIFTMKSALATYQPQAHHNMLVAGMTKAYLSVILGNEWDYVEIDLNPEYAEALVKVETEFWECVRLDMPPSDEPVLVPPPEATRVLDMEGSREWGALADIWLANKKPAKLFADSVEEIKKMIPADVKIATGKGIRVSRDKRRALRITATDEDGD